MLENNLPEPLSVSWTEPFVGVVKGWVTRSKCLIWMGDRWAAGRVLQPWLCSCLRGSAELLDSPPAKLHVNECWELHKLWKIFLVLLSGLLVCGGHSEPCQGTVWAVGVMKNKQRQSQHILLYWDITLVSSTHGVVSCLWELEWRKSGFLWIYVSRAVVGMWAPK